MLFISAGVVPVCGGEPQHFHTSSESAQCLEFLSAKWIYHEEMYCSSSLTSFQNRSL